MPDRMAANMVFTPVSFPQWRYTRAILAFSFKFVVPEQPLLALSFVKLWKSTASS